MIEQPTIAPATLFVVEYDSDTKEWIATADDQVMTFEYPALAYHWLAAQILESESE